MHRLYEQLRDLFTTPLFPEDIEKTRMASALFLLVQATLLTFLVAFTGVLLTYFAGYEVPWLSLRLLATLVMLPLLVSLLGVAQRGAVRLASHLFVVLIWSATTFTAYFTGGLQAMGYGASIITLLIAGMLLGMRGALVYLILTMLSGLGMLYATQEGILPTGDLSSPVATFFIYILFFIIALELLFIATDSINKTLVRAQSELRERERAETSLLKSELEYRMLIDQAPDGILTLSADQLILSANSSACTILDRSEAEMLSRNVNEFLQSSSSDQPSFISSNPPSANTAQEAYLLHNKNRPRSWIWASLKRLPDARYQIFFLDITDRQEQQQRILLRDTILEALTYAAEQFLKAPDWRNNIDALLARWGQALQASHVYIFEHEPNASGELRSTMRYEWAAPGCDAELASQKYQDISLCIPGFERSYESLCKGLPYVYMSRQSTPFEQDHYQPLGIKALIETPVFVRDAWWGTVGFDDCVQERIWSSVEIESIQIAADLLAAAVQRQLADAEIRQANTELEQRVAERTAQLAATNAELQSFSYSVSHDLRAPLRALNAYSQILLSDYDAILPEDGKFALQAILQSANKMDDLVGALLSFSRLARIEPFIVPVDLSLIAQQVLDELRAAEPERSVECEITPDLVAHADERLIHNVISNLLGNAWKYTGKTAQARIEFGLLPSAEPQDGAPPTYYVRDNGAGFDMRYSDKLFGAFQRLHRADEYPGHGIGLAIVQRIIQRHGGKVWAEGEVDQGATFYFTLPAV